MIRRASMAAAVLALSWLGMWVAPAVRPVQTTAPPARIGDQDFWRLIAGTSEPNGYFDSDNLVSNENGYQTVIPSLMALPHTGAYVGVGPDQNFSYIVALRPPVAFIMDVRRGNLQLHLMYKAILELSPDRAAFLSMLFSRSRPAGLTARTSADDLFRAFDRAEPDKSAYAANLHAILKHLETDHGFRLDPDDEQGIAYVYSNFFSGGPALRFVSSRGGNRYPSYEDLQLVTDAAGVRRGYLASEDAYGTLRTWEQRNLIVPVVGNFAGPHALGAIGTYLRGHDTPLRVFYTSNVERYLFQDGLWRTFIRNLRALPIDDASTLIRSCFDSCSGPGDSRAVTLLDTIPALLRDVDAGRVTGYGDVLRRSRRR